MSTLATNLLTARRTGALAIVLFVNGIESGNSQTLTSSSGFNTTTVAPIYTANLPAGAIPTLPGSVELDADLSASVIQLDVFLNQDVQFDAMSNYRTLFTFQNEMGRLRVTSNNQYSIENVLSLNDTTAIGNAAILAIGAPNPNANPGVGQDVDVTINQTISVSGTGSTNIAIPLPLKLEPPAFRTAQLSGVTAVSYGLQDADNDHSRAGGTVTVNTGEAATFDVVQTSNNVTTAGISATSAAGPAKNNYFNDPYGVDVTQNGNIVVTADQGMGIFANTTGGQFSISDSSVAVGGTVDVTLTTNADGMDGAFISHTGQTGIGIFALSEVSPINDTSSIPIQGGQVTVTLEEKTSISVGNETGPTSQLSVGILAVSAAANELLDPFTTITTPLDTNGQGSGGQVTVNNSGTIKTFGDTSVGIAGLSIGGASIVATSDPSSSGNSYLGSNDDHKGEGKEITIHNRTGGTIKTKGIAAHGIVAMSTASGGLLNNLGEVTGTTPANLTGLGIGNGPSASSDSGNNGGTIIVTNDGSVTTGNGMNNSDASIGILAQSIGGGGGSASNKSSLFVGDAGGAGGTGGNINIGLEQNSSLTTYGLNSVGILAQSVGGGGGNGGNAQGFFVSVGGRGGDGGDGGRIDFVFDGALNTTANHSAGAIAQSIGGGGGHGGSATTTSLLPSAVEVGVGGNAGGGGTGGNTDAIIRKDATIKTVGNNSAGVILQSIGGGGGTGGAATSKSVDLLSAAISIGGAGGSGGNGGKADLVHSGSITTGDPTAASILGAPNNKGADSIGVLIQSIGGGGGHAGSAVADAVGFAIGDEDPIALALPISIGGLGGGGGDSEDITFASVGSITTWGDGSHGALLQSIGGGGGNGGDSTANTTALAIDAASIATGISQGGRGAGGGNGRKIVATVDVDSDITDSGTIKTYGQNAAGLIAQSIGGGGGNGGLGTANAYNVNLTGDDAIGADFVLAMGGSSDRGGSAGPIDITNNGTIKTDGSGSQGILAQAIGGGGGNAGGGSIGGGNAEFTLDIAIGGSGGGGGNALNSDTTNYSVTVNNTGTIETKRGDSTGIVAQSIGGGGGNGGSADILGPTGIINFALGLDQAESYTSNMLVGGNGGDGGSGGNVTVGNEGSIKTEGARSYGVLAQSISGGGGTGGSANASSNPFFGSGFLQSDNENYKFTLAVGGKGGSGASSESVEVLNSDKITTNGYAAHGIIAQSVGGGGGIGADGSVDTQATIGLGIELNQGSGSGANGGSVTVTQGQDISTSGHHSNGIVAQSIGGGGGIGSTGSDLAPFTVKPNVGLIPSLTINPTLGINLDSGDNSDGGETTVNLGDPNNPVSNTITTSGDWAIGALAQSIGAGGGKTDTITGSNISVIPTLDVKVGGVKGNGHGNTVDILSPGMASINTGNSTSGYGAYGLLAQSIGGGGGIATDASSAATGSLALGGQSDDVNGDGGTVSMSVGSTSVTTQGTAAHGVVLQSIGGGGGVAGTGATEDYAESLTGVNAPTLTLGGQDSTGNSDGITIDGVVSSTTYGDNAFGVVAQSIGGGGGIATTKQTGGAIDLGLTADDTSTRDGGQLSLTFQANSDIQTSGAGSHGLVAQSIGGGGGIANPDSNTGLDLEVPMRTATAHGYGKQVTLTLEGDISTTGDGANGVVAQVIGGGGGLYNNFAGSTGGANSSQDAGQNGNLAISLASGASIQTSGQNADAILAQNVTGNGQSGKQIMVTIYGSVFSEQGNGLVVHGGDSNNSLSVEIGGSLQSQDLSKDAVTTVGSETLSITNSGLISGSISGSVSLVDAQAANSTFENLGTGIFNSGDVVNATLTDSGQFIVGGDGNILTSQINFDYSQLAGGLLEFDVESESAFDQLAFDTASGDFQGNIEISLLNGGRALREGDQMILVTASNGPTMNMYEPSFINNVSYSNKPDDIVLLLFENTEGALVLDVISVPEPSSAGLLSLATLGWLLRRKKVQHTRSNV